LLHEIGGHDGLVTVEGRHGDPGRPCWFWRAGDTCVACARHDSYPASQLNFAYAARCVTRVGWPVCPPPSPQEGYDALFSFRRSGRCPRNTSSRQAR
jgi:hypothetical protein